MASFKREAEYEVNRRRYSDMKSTYRKSYWLSLIPSAGVWLVLTLYYGIRGLALLAGANTIIAEKIISEAMDKPVESDLFFKTPYLFLGYLLIIAVFSFLGLFFRKRGFFYATIAVYGACAVYAFVSMFNGGSILFGMYLIAYAGYGIWLSLLILGLFKENDYLVRQEGYPDFLDIIDEPKPMANTRGLHYNKSEYIKRKQKERKASGEPAEKPDFEMEELSVDADLPKGSRKIDNLM